MMATTNITGSGTNAQTFEESLCSSVWVGEFKQQSISFSAINILLFTTAILGNSLILVALHKESSLHSPSKLLYSCLATTDLLVGLVTQPLYTTYWMSGSRTLESLSVRKGRSLRFKLCIMFSVFVDFNSHKRGPTSRHVVGTEIQRGCNFEAYVYYFSHLLGCMYSRWFILSSQLPYRPLVQLFNYTILFDNLIRLVQKDFLRSQSSSGSNTRLCSATAEPTECTEHGATQKGSLQCAVGAVSFSCLLYATIYSENCDLS